MAVSPGCPVILGFNNMKYCNPPGLNLILPQLAKSSGLHSYQSFSLHSSLWSCCPCKDFSVVLWWLEPLVQGTLVLIVASVVAPSPLPFCTLQVEQLQWKFGPSV